MPKLLAKPPLGPVPRTIATYRAIRRLDRIAAALLHVAWWPINAALVGAVSIALWVERRRRDWTATGPVPVGPRVEQLTRWPWSRHVFRCTWCGSDTQDGAVFSLSCCRMAADEHYRREGIIQWRT